MRTHRLCLALLFGLGSVVAPARLAAEEPVARLAAPSASIARANVEAAAVKQYELELKLIRTSPDGKEVVAASPRIVTTEGRPACVETGWKVASPAAAMGIEAEDSMHVGTRFSAKVVRKKGRILLDVTAEISDARRLFDNAGSGLLGLWALRAAEAACLLKTNTSLLNASTDVLRAALSGADGHLVDSTSVRAVIAVTLGRTLTLPVPHTKGDRWEIVVREPKLSAATGPGDVSPALWREIKSILAHSE